MILGRYDARFEGSDIDAAGDTPGYDPSDSGIVGAYVSALHDYLERELKYTSDDTYYPSGPGVNQIWDHTHRVGSQTAGGGVKAEHAGIEQLASAKDALQRARNHLKVLEQHVAEVQQDLRRGIYDDREEADDPPEAGSTDS